MTSGAITQDLPCGRRWRHRVEAQPILQSAALERRQTDRRPALGASLGQAGAERLAHEGRQRRPVLGRVGLRRRWSSSSREMMVRKRRLI